MTAFAHDNPSVWKVFWVSPSDNSSLHHSLFPFPLLSPLPLPPTIPFIFVRLSSFVAQAGLKFTTWPRLGNLWIILPPQMLEFQTCVNMPSWIHSYPWTPALNFCPHFPDRLAWMPFLLSSQRDLMLTPVNPGFQCWATYRANSSWGLPIPGECWALLWLNLCHMWWILCCWTSRLLQIWHSICFHWVYHVRIHCDPLGRIL